MIGGVRVMYNATLYRRQKYYNETKTSLKIKPTDLYDEFPWMKGLDSQGLCNAFQDLNKAYSEYEVPEYEQTGNCIGLDLGVKDLIITSDGQKFENKKFIKNSEKKIKHIQRCYSKKKKGSKNQKKG